MILRILLLLMFISGLLFSNYSTNTEVSIDSGSIYNLSENKLDKVTNFQVLIERYPEFLQSNYFEDDIYYYYLSVFEYKDKNSSFNLAKSQARLTAITDLTDSICCGFDTSNFIKNLRNTNIVDSENDKVQYSFRINNRSTSLPGLETVFYERNEKSIISAIRIKKSNINFNIACECNVVIN